MTLTVLTLGVLSLAIYIIYISLYIKMSSGWLHPFSPLKPAHLAPYYLLHISAQFPDAAVFLNSLVFDQTAGKGPSLPSSGVRKLALRQICGVGCFARRAKSRQTAACAPSLQTPAVCEYTTPSLLIRHAAMQGIIQSMSFLPISLSCFAKDTRENVGSVGQKNLQLSPPHSFVAGPGPMMLCL